MDLIEHNGQVLLYYAIGDQQSWGGLKRATFHGSLAELCSHYFPTS